MQAQNYLSYSQNIASSSSLQYYIVPSSWFSQVWKILRPPNGPSISNPSWKETIGPINNASLQLMTSTPQFITDFVLIGPNVWLLLSSKLGHDALVWPCPCVRSPTGAGGMVVQLTALADEEGGATRTIPLPPSGRFPYEQYFSTTTAIVPLFHTEDKENAMEEDEATTSNERTDPPARIAWRPNDPTTALPPQSPSSSSSVGSGGKRALRSSASLVRRQYGSGLGNLGNTCFMNSTLQCLAHTPALQNYFLSRQYRQDLNQKNPLGTGGELATEFAQLLQEMWISLTSTVAPLPRGGDPVVYTTASHVVYPRNFKYTLGKHAAQFMGYDQHDSQELATYLLDALHEDCNRITEKPYIEKPEQTEEESDQEASDKAWDLHLQREDSHVLEYFMGQVKSRVQCNQEHCQRISTTFDPFMFLSVPIPGSDDRTVRLTFVPIEPQRRPQKLAVKVSKLATVEELVRRLMEQVATEETTTVDDFVVCDMWKHTIFEWFQSKDDLEKIRDNDETFVYQVRSLAEIRQCEALWNDETANDAPNGDIDTEISQRLALVEWKPTGKRRLYQLDLETLTQLNRSPDRWSELLQTKYMKTPLMLVNAFHPNKGSSEERVRIYRRLAMFLDELRQSLLEDEDSEEEEDDENVYDDGASGPKRVRADDSVAVRATQHITKLMDCSYRNSYFTNVKSLQDVAILEFLASKMFREIILLERKRKEVHPNGVLLEVRIGCTEGNYPSLPPLVVRIPSNTTVFQFRELMAHRLSRCLRRSTNGRKENSSRNARKMDIWTSPDDDWREERHSPDYESPTENGNREDDAMDVVEPMDIVRRVSMSFERKNSASNHRSYFPSKPLGSVLGRHANNNYLSALTNEPLQSVVLAEPSHLEEKEYIAELVGNAGQINLNIPSSLMDYAFDFEEFQAVDEEAVLSSSVHGSRTNTSITVLDCVEKFCQMEQLEESEQWYCNKCKEHVCAWKQFHIYRSPPHLIIHLKRFQYSARTHRRQKINTHVDFPLIGLDLSNQVLHWTENEKPLYDCYAVSNHYGGLGGGHYTAYALNDDGVWCHYDDSRITSHVEPSDVISQAAYVLYYRRRDVSAQINFEMIAAALNETQANDLRHEPIMNPIFRSLSEPNKPISRAARIDDNFLEAAPNPKPTDPVHEEDDGSCSSMTPAIGDSGKRAAVANVVPEDEDYSASSSNPNDEEEDPQELARRPKGKAKEYKRGSSLPLQ